MMDDDSGGADQVTRAAYDAMLSCDWSALRLLLHPYLQWTTSDGTRVRGRTNVMERLQNTALPVEAPTQDSPAVELRGGQIYRWEERLVTREQ